MSKKDKNKKKKIKYKETFKELWLFARNYKRYLFPVILTSIILNVLYLVDSFIFKEIVKNIELYLQKSIIKIVFIKSLMIILFIYISYNIFKIIVAWLDIHFINRFDNNIMTDIRKKYFSHILQLDNQFHSNHKTGTLISRLTRVANSVESSFDTIIYQFLPFFLKLLIFIPVIFQIGKIEVLLIILFIIIFLLYSFHFITQFNIGKKHVNKLVDKENAIVSDVFTNIDSVKYFAKENYILKKYYNIVGKVKKQRLKIWEIWKNVVIGQYLILIIFIAAIFYVSISRFLNEELMLADIVFLYTIIISLIQPLFGFHWAVRKFTNSLVDIQSLFDYGKQENRIKDKKNAKDIIIKQGQIEFKNIDFDYSDDKRKVFRNFNLDIKAGETVALVGQSGCGKSTLIKLLYRFHDLNKGKILIDNQNIANVKKGSLRDNLSIVPQEAILFDDTIFNNIKFSRPEATDKDVWQAIKYAELSEFVKSLKKKEKTIVGERGIKLSGGQKQRVSIARAILADKKILLLDEATSALDTETEMKIQKSLEYLIKNRTSIVIAHRLSTIMRADKIIVMKEGKILQIGKHNELIKIEGEYKKLWDLQKSSF